MVNFQQPTADHRRVVEEASQILMKELPPRVVRRFSQRLRTNDTSLRNLLSDKVMFIHDGVVSHGPKQVASQIFESHRFQSVWHDWERNTGNRWSRHGHVPRSQNNKKSQDRQRVQQSLKLSPKKDDDDEYEILTVELVTLNDYENSSHCSAYSTQETQSSWSSSTRSLGSSRSFFSSPRRSICGGGCGVEDEKEDAAVANNSAVVSPHIFCSKAAGSLC